MSRRLTTGSAQHLACWPIAAQILMKSSMLVGVDGAVKVSISPGSESLSCHLKEWLTRSAVQICESKNVCCAALRIGVSSCADWGLASFHCWDCHGDRSAGKESSEDS
jgi:hypothetical protein